ncbi:alanine/ornithine racemase family PLP-dependent enzyme [Clostridium estertheticum]|uniref:ornithine racemase Orr n=1 Tax=Clostridium estertheticum TaxID=238834 RepID=UPI001CF1CD99|nr:ornithine racemase Orr [Clostridium estertheticum]MCB2307918.1 alanine/ornithine racemase family PLP-dependent enzyme [Clostridium estertheticum]MCB2346042.1 alanine/ornithine racemase family PLP-dependent enzyme [Clostridium estertheticum]MCB2351300.1 alanine/ornithine racemase family PLP-dependent enzyme [Clostridium estertheticum]WAG44188.1 alanine/ornithine racemase family PLP-dependent enzyme [Clostridium estertheticum]
MGKKYPCMEVDLKKLTHNVKTILAMCNKKQIDVVEVTKVYCAQVPIVEAIIEAGVAMVGDSRILNLKKLKDLNCKKMLLRIPMISEVSEVVKYSDCSLNSEIDTIEQLSKAAKELNKIHNIILMVDLGDLREGVLVDDVVSIVSKIVKLDNIKLIGLGTNVTCYGGVIPDSENLGKLTKLKIEIEKGFDLKLPVISGGNSSSLYMVINNTMPKDINQLRIGEAIVLGRETSFGKPVPNCYDDAFILSGEIVEIKSKPTVPTGTIGMDAFGHIPSFEDKGIRKRAIIALGRQDIRVEGITPLDNDISIFGASSDHLILDVTDSKKQLIVGSIVEFKIDYGCLLKAMTSPYVEKYYNN